MNCIVYRARMHARQNGYLRCFAFALFLFILLLLTPTTGLPTEERLPPVPACQMELELYLESLALPAEQQDPLRRTIHHALQLNPIQGSRDGLTYRLVLQPSRSSSKIAHFDLLQLQADGSFKKAGQLVQSLGSDSAPRSLSLFLNPGSRDIEVDSRNQGIGQKILRATFEALPEGRSLDLLIQNKPTRKAVAHALLKLAQTPQAQMHGRVAEETGDWQSYSYYLEQELQKLVQKKPSQFLFPHILTRAGFEGISLRVDLDRVLSWKDIHRGTHTEQLLEEMPFTVFHSATRPREGLSEQIAQSLEALNPFQGKSGKKYQIKTESRRELQEDEVQQKETSVEYVLTDQEGRFLGDGFSIHRADGSLVDVNADYRSQKGSAQGEGLAQKIWKIYHHFAADLSLQNVESIEPHTNQVLGKWMQEAMKEPTYQTLLEEAKQTGNFDSCYFYLNAKLTQRVNREAITQNTGALWFYLWRKIGFGEFIVELKSRVGPKEKVKAPSLEQTTEKAVRIQMRRIQPKQPEQSQPSASPSQSLTPPSQNSPLHNAQAILKTILSRPKTKTLWEICQKNKLSDFFRTYVETELNHEISKVSHSPSPAPSLPTLHSYVQIRMLPQSPPTTSQPLTVEQISLTLLTQPIEANPKGRLEKRLHKLELVGEKTQSKYRIQVTRSGNRDPQSVNWVLKRKAGSDWEAVGYGSRSLSPTGTIRSGETYLQLSEQIDATGEGIGLKLWQIYYDFIPSGSAIEGSVFNLPTIERLNQWMVETMNSSEFRSLFSQSQGHRDSLTALEDYLDAALLLKIQQHAPLRVSQGGALLPSLFHKAGFGYQHWEATPVSQFWKAKSEKILSGTLQTKDLEGFGYDFRVFKLPQPLND